MNAEVEPGRTAQAEDVCCSRPFSSPELTSPQSLRSTSCQKGPRIPMISEKGRNNKLAFPLPFGEMVKLHSLVMKSLPRPFVQLCSTIIYWRWFLKPPRALMSVLFFHASVFLPGKEWLKNKLNVSFCKFSKVFFFLNMVHSLAVLYWSYHFSLRGKRSGCRKRALVS